MEQIQFRWLQQPWPRDADSSWHAFKRSALPSSRLTGLPLTTTPRSDLQMEDDCQEPVSRQNSLAVTFGSTDWRSGRKMSVCQGSAATTKPNAYRRRSFCTHFPFFQLENWSFLHFYTHPSACWVLDLLPPKSLSKAVQEKSWSAQTVSGSSFHTKDLISLKLPTNSRPVPNPEGSVHHSVDFRLGGVTSDPSLCKHKVSVSVFPSFGSFLLITYQITNPADNCMATSATFSALHLVSVDSGWASLPRLSHRSTCRGRVSGVLRHLTSLSHPGYHQLGSVWDSEVEKLDVKSTLQNLCQFSKSVCYSHTELFIYLFMRTFVIFTFYRRDIWTT